MINLSVLNLIRSNKISQNKNDYHYLQEWEFKFFEIEPTYVFDLSIYTFSLIV
jgi:hypothetical protein